MTSNDMKVSLVRDQYIDGVIGREIFAKVMGIPCTDNSITRVSNFFFRKANKTLEAICILSEAGFAEDSLILGRTLFELAVYLKWIALPDSIEQKSLEQSRSSMTVTGSELRG